MPENDTRTLCFFRHAPRIPGEDALSPEGLALAQQVGAGLGRFDRVISSPAQRCIQTARAMGFTPQVGQNWVLPDFEVLSGSMPEGSSYVSNLRVMRNQPYGRELARLLAQQWQSEAEALKPGGRELIITHGGHIDYIAVACCLDESLSEADVAAWGPPVGRAEGYSLAYNAGKFSLARWYRLDK
ncbi:MAG: histidine phosphatase family protein [Anaerolineae bacterium]